MNTNDFTITYAIVESGMIISVYHDSSEMEFTGRMQHADIRPEEYIDFHVVGKILDNGDWTLEERRGLYLCVDIDRRHIKCKFEVKLTLSSSSYAGLLRAMNAL